MKRILILVLIMALSGSTMLAQRSSRGSSSRSSSASRSSSSGVVRVKGYTRKDGTYVAPHVRSRPDGNFDNNWSTKGNVNPYTGKPGTRVTPPDGYGGNQVMAPSISRPRTTTASPSEEPSYRAGPEGESLTLAAAPASPSASSTEASGSPCPVPEPMQIAVVIKLKANLRDIPNNLGAAVREVGEGNALVLNGDRSGGWYKVLDVVSGQEGWIHGNTIRIALTR